MNPVYEDRINVLDPRIRSLCRELLTVIRSRGFDVRVIQGLRTPSEQDALYAQGRDGNPGRVVTNAKAGYSWHNFGLAFDLGLFDAAGKYIEDSDETFRTVIGPLGEAVGLTWGGRWTRPDYPHFQLANIEVTPTDADRRKLNI